MKTTPEDFLSALYQLQSQNKIKHAILLPPDETIYEVQLNTRQIQAPDKLGLEFDHYAETYYFKINRFFDNMDLTSCVGLIQFINHNRIEEDGKGLPHYYVIPYFDATTLKDSDELIFPWCIDNRVTAATGPVSFVFRFYKMSDTYTLTYLISTLPATSKIVDTLDGAKEGQIEGTPEFPIIPGDRYAWIINEIQSLKDTNDLYWEEIK